MKIRTGIKEVYLAVRIPVMTLFSIERSFTYKDAVVRVGVYDCVRVWADGRMAACVYGCRDV